MFDKLKNLLNVKGWLENFVAKTVVSKAVKHATSAVVGLLGSVVFTVKVKPILDSFGISVDPVHLAEGLTVMLTGLAGSLMNVAIKVMDEKKN